MSSEVRIERLAPAHLDGVVTLHHKCFAPQIDPVQKMGRRFVRKTFHFFLDDPISFGFVATHEGTIIGYVVGRLGLWGPALDRYRMGAAIYAFLTHPWLLFESHFSHRLGNAIRKPFRRRGGQPKQSSTQPAAVASHEGLATLAIIGVDADFSSARASEHLLTHAEEFCRQRGMLYLRAGVQRSNIQSRFLYRRRGYTESAASAQSQSLLYHLALRS